MSISVEYILHRLSVREFYHMVRYHAWRSKGQEEYQKLINLKHSVK